VLFLIRSSQIRVLTIYIYYVVKILLYDISFPPKIDKDRFVFPITHVLYLTDTDQNIAINFDLRYRNTKFRRHFVSAIIIIMIITIIIIIIMVILLRPHY
jgi:hypothetical protein